jgi:amino acid adenylation domain-containing protein
MGATRRAIHLSAILDDAASTAPERIAVEDESGRRVTYADLARQADRVATRLARWGIGRGDRVGLFLPKGIEAVASIHGILRRGASYVPVDPTAPLRRGAAILADAGVRAVVVHASLASGLVAYWDRPGPRPRLIVVGPEGESTTCDATWGETQSDSAPSPLPPSVREDDLAYVLYTSGSTGTPKGVMLTHRNALCFLAWCAGELGLRDADRFSAHAPFHFDLSIFDLFACCRHRGTLVVVGEGLARDPARLASFVAEREIDVWYSAPSILGLMADTGRLDARGGSHAPRVVLFAGEVFPIRGLKVLRTAWPRASLWNLYGPTETNVCTALPIPAAIPAERATPYPIGRVCPPHLARVVDEAGRDVAPGGAGELWISGPGVMRGYFGRPDLDAHVFVRDDRGTAWYRTGDLVSDDGTGCLQFHGRRDRMVKKRGYRIELGEIEVALDRHEDVERAAVVARSGEAGVSIDAFVAVKPERKASVIAMKRHCTLFLPHYMVPDRIRFLPALPMTSTDKVDYQSLKALAEHAAEHRLETPST